MLSYNIKKTQYRVSDFLSWQKSNTLTLSPAFQRRSVWKKGAKSYLLDTVVKGMPMPIILLREKKSDLTSLEPRREVVDGQQRLRTILSFIDSKLLQDYNSKIDDFVVRENHNKEISDKKFSELDDSNRQKILDYEFSVHILPANLDDRQILEIFARLNATGVKLNAQELRNAEFYGKFKTAVYTLASEQLNRWREWGVFSDFQIMRMDEAELTTELFQFIIDSVQTKSQKSITNIYKTYDENFKNEDEIKKRFRNVMDSIDEIYGKNLSTSIFQTKAFFYILFAVIYLLTYGKKKTLEKINLEKMAPNKLPLLFKNKLEEIEKGIRDETYSGKIMDLFETRRNTNAKQRKAIIQFLLDSV